MTSSAYTSWIEVDLAAVSHNLRQVRKLVGTSVRIMAVVKANAYGHGAVETARAFEDAGADFLGVTTIEEGIELRAAGVCAPILVFSPLLPDQFADSISNRLDQTIFSTHALESLYQSATRIGRPARIHVKVDTGMGRLGLLPEECMYFLSEITRHPQIEIAGIYTHFADAGARDLSQTREQNSRFSALVDILHANNVPTGLCHAANSAAALRLPESYYDMVRPGTILYGQFPTPYAKGKVKLKESWRFKTRVVALRKLCVGRQVGYGAEYAAKRPTVAAILPIGYADGFTVAPESLTRRDCGILRVIGRRILGRGDSTCVNVRGRQVPVIGRVSMQMCMIDVTDVSGVEVGDEVTVPARRVTASSRIPRTYMR